MSKEISQVELRNIIANKTTLPPDIVNAFVDQFFEEIRKTIVEDSFLKLEGLGLFRIIKSGESQRILFLGSKQSVERSLNISDLKNKVDELLPENRIDDVESSEYPIFEKIEHPLHFNTEEVVLDIVNEDSNVNPILEDQILYYPEKKQKSKLLKISAVVVIIAALVSLVAFIYSRNKKNDEGINYTINFVELENLDPSNFSYIIIPESDVSLEYISKTYYGCVEYWPYIYNANEDFVDNQLMIQAGSIVKIPKVMIDIIDYQNGNALIKANKLGEQIKLGKKIIKG